MQHIDKSALPPVVALIAAAVESKNVMLAQSLLDVTPLQNKRGIYGLNVESVCFVAYRDSLCFTVMLCRRWILQKYKTKTVSKFAQWNRNNCLPVIYKSLKNHVLLVSCVDWLVCHSVDVLGTTQNELGICVVDQYGSSNGGYSQTVWLPADFKKLREWMNY